MIRVLAPIDFSSASVNSANYAAKFIESLGGGILELIHCINIQRRAGMFLRIDDVLKEQASQDLARLAKDIIDRSVGVDIAIKVTNNDPKTYLASYILKEKFDYVVMGTKGLSAIKEVTIGSVTDYLMNKIDTPIIVVPDGVEYLGLSRLVIGVDDRPMKRRSLFQPVINILDQLGSRLFLVHISEKNDHPMEYDPRLDDYLEGYNYTFDRLNLEGSITDTLYKYCGEVHANMLCMIHRKTNWFTRLLIASSTKSGLFDIRLPLLVLPQE